MRFNTHPRLPGGHALLSASKWHWLNYDDNKLADTWRSSQAVERGTRLHALAAECIELGVKLPKSRKTLNCYVNDAIGFRMTPEQTLYYSDNCFGTADAVSFEKGKLRIHDLKTGSVPAHIEQLLIYAGLFCLEYQVDPAEIETELRIYQNDEVVRHEPAVDEMRLVVDKIIHADEVVSRLRAEEAQR